MTSGILLAVRLIQADQAARIHGNFSAALDFAHEALHLYRDELRNPFLAAISVVHLGLLAAMQGNYPEALAQFEQAEALYRQMGNQRMVNGMKSEQAHVLRQQSLYEEALALYRQTILAWQELGARPPLAHDLECLAFIAIAREQAQNAALLQRMQLFCIEQPVCWGQPKLCARIPNRRCAPMSSLNTTRISPTCASKWTPQAYAEAWAQGRSLNMDEAVAFALAE